MPSLTREGHLDSWRAAGAKHRAPGFSPSSWLPLSSQQIPSHSPALLRGKGGRS